MLPQKDKGNREQEELIAFFRIDPWEESVLKCIIRALEHKTTIIHLCVNFVYSKTLVQRWL